MTTRRSVTCPHAIGPAAIRDWLDRRLPCEREGERGRQCREEQPEAVE